MYGGLRFALQWLASALSVVGGWLLIESLRKRSLASTKRRRKSSGSTRARRHRRQRASACVPSFVGSSDQTEAKRERQSVNERPPTRLPPRTSRPPLRVKPDTWTGWSIEKGWSSVPVRVGLLAYSPGAVLWWGMPESLPWMRTGYLWIDESLAPLGLSPKLRRIKPSASA